MRPFGTRVIVCGGRRFEDDAFLDATLDALSREHGPFAAVIHGNANGADRASGRWARKQRIPEWPVPAEWSKYGNAAGPIRNKKMLGMHVALVVAFPGGKGTKNMVKQARAAGVTVIEVRTP